MKLQKIISLNPGKNYEVIGEVPITTKAEIYNKVKKARQAQKSWGFLDIQERIKILRKLYDIYAKNEKQLTSLIAQEMGMPVSVCKKVDIGFGLQFMQGYLDNAQNWLAPEITFENEKEIHYLFFEPKGVAGLSIPWNYPFCNFIWATMQNLVVGNTVVFKHSEECILTGKLLEELTLTAGLPEGVFNEVYGDGVDVGESLMNSDVDLLWFTGSTGVGKHLYQVAAKKFIPAVLELGGSAAGIVFEDADLKKTIESIYNNRYLNCGQTCDGLKRLIVHRSIFDQVVNGLKSLVLSKKIGDPLDFATDLGPLVAKRQLIAIEEQVADALKKGAHVICGAKNPSGFKGAYYEPTILTKITFDMKVWKEEVFGPVLPIVPFETEEEALSLANDSQYGLGGYIYTANKERAMRVSKLMQTGNINVNSAFYVIAQDPFGGYKNSGIGREHGKVGLQELCNLKLVAFEK